MSKRLFTRAALTGALFVLAPGIAPRADWPQLGGPHRHNAVPEAALPEGGVRLETLWQRPLGSGYSGIAIAGGLAVTMHTEGESDRLTALDAATGKTRWSIALGEAYRGHDGSEDGPLSTPLVHAGRVFAVTPRGDLLAVALEDGKLFWRKSLVDDFHAAVPDYGFTTSPLAAGENVVVQAGGSDGHGLCALDAGTGELRWKLGDGATQYRSPTTVAIGGKTLVVAVTDRAIRAADPATGKLVAERSYPEDHFDHIATLAAVSGGRLLVTGSEHSRLLEIVSTDEGFAIEERWETTELKQSYNPAVHRDGVLYGYSGTYLVAVDAATGERLWKSREPGKGVPILVGGHLAVFGAGGKLHLGSADRTGFKAEAACTALDTSGLTSPSYSDGAFFVRNLTGIAAVGVSEAAASAALVAPEIPELTARTAFGSFVRDVEARATAAERTSAVDAWLAEHPTTPIVESERIVHFVYRGAGRDVGIEGAFAPGGTQSLLRVAGTDLFYRSYEVDPAARMDYALVVDFNPAVPDARNPLAVGERSELRMPGWKVPAWTPEPGREARGKLESFDLASQALGETRKVYVYLPPSYAEGGESWPLLVVPDIFGTRADGRLAEIMDLLEEAGRSVPIVAWVPFPEGFGFWDEGYADRRDAMVQFVADEMLPQIASRYRVREGREHRALAGFGWGAFPALYAATMRSDVFGKAASVSMMTYAPFNAELAEMLAARKDAPQLEVYAGWGAYDTSEEFEEHISLPEMNRQAATIVETAGHRVTKQEIRASLGWGSWWAHVGPVVEQFFAPPQ